MNTTEDRLRVLLEERAQQLVVVADLDSVINRDIAAEQLKSETLVIEQRRPRWLLAAAAALIVLAGAAGLMATRADRETTPPAGQPTAPLRAFEFVVFLEPGATGADSDRVGQFLHNDSRVVAVEFVDQQQARAEFEDIFSDQPDLIDQVSDQPLPESYRVTVHTTMDDTGRDLTRDVRTMAAVREVITRGLTIAPSLPLDMLPADVDPNQIWHEPTSHLATPDLHLVVWDGDSHRCGHLTGTTNLVFCGTADIFISPPADGLRAIAGRLPPCIAEAQLTGPANLEGTRTAIGASAGDTFTGWIEGQPTTLQGIDHDNQVRADVHLDADPTDLNWPATTCN